MTAPAMDGVLDSAVARAALEDPATGPIELSLIAQHHPALRAEVAMHPSAYPGLLDWLDGHGDPLLSAVVSMRRGVAQAEPMAAGTASTAQWIAPQTEFGSPGSGVAPYANTKRKPPTKLLMGLGVGVVVVALAVTGFATRGFGLFPAGGAATPEEEAVKVVNKTVELVNSFSALNLLSNPLSAVGSLSDEYAPSEARLSARQALGSGSSSIDTTDLLGLTGDTIGLIADLAGAFRVQADNLKTDVSQITDDIAIVSYVDGTVTVTADLDKLRGALTKVPDVASMQFSATAEKYGLHPSQLSLEDSLPEGWLEDAIDEVEATFPITVDLADYDGWLHGGSEPPNYTIGQLYRQLSAVVVVKEGGRWYLSPMLTGFVGSNGVSSILEDFRPDSDDKRLLNVEPSRNNSPVEAAEALAKAFTSGRERAVLAELPLAERRYAAFTGIAPFPGLLSQLATMETSDRPDVDFSEIARNGDRAKLRIDELSPLYMSYGEPVSIEDGTCLLANGEKYCLSDYLDSRRAADALDSLRGVYWGDFEETTGVHPDDLLDKLETAAESAMDAVDPDQVGIVVIQENGSWFVSAGATLGDLQNQAIDALVVGLKAAQNR